MILIKDLNIAYGDNEVIKSLNLSLPDHTIHGIVGLNGTGKTTLLNAIFGLKKAGSGKIEMNGEKLTKKQMSYFETENFFIPILPVKNISAYLKMMFLKKLTGTKSSSFH